jgi:hypothetical protein
MTLKIRMKSVTEAQPGVASAAIWRVLSRLIMGWNGGRASGTA